MINVPGLSERTIRNIPKGFKFKRRFASTLEERQWVESGKPELLHEKYGNGPCRLVLVTESKPMEIVILEDSRTLAKVLVWLGLADPL